ncbi:MAG: YceI family protein, partial [Sediminibacterium sp.]|nr:YceI family protein [Sediminibacterium sp.]
MKGFEFDRALMMEHFNENYVESDRFPKTVFKGQIVNNETINYTKDAVYPAKVKGKLTMHGETKELETEGKITVKGGKISVTAEFAALLADYKIAIPQLVADKVAKNAKITVDCSL